MLVLVGGDHCDSRNLGESDGNEDKHKAPALPHIHPLSLQDGGGRFPSFLDSGVKDHQDGWHLCDEQRSDISCIISIPVRIESETK